MKHKLIIGLILAALLAAVWFIFRDGKTPPTEGQTGANSNSTISTENEPAEASTSTNLPTLDLLPTVEMKEARYEPDYVALARSRENPPFEFVGRGTSGKVVDRQGQVLMESGKEIGIFAVVVGPDKQHILVKGGDAINFVLHPTTGLKLQLPVYPPGANMLGLRWQWLGETKLLGLSGVEVLNAKGEATSSCGGNNVAEAKLYVFDVTTQKLAEVRMPSSVKPSVVNVVDVMHDGHVHLVHVDPHGGANKDLGWFRIDTSE